jgi:transposase-like protein
MYSDELRHQAVRLYADGLGFRQIARHLKVDHVTIMNWVKAHTDQLPPAPLPAERPLHIVEMDEVYTFVGKKKNGSTW